MKFVLMIDVENDAFNGGNMRPELSRILSELAQALPGDRYLDDRNFQNLRDANGNTVGAYALKTHARIESDK